MNRIIVASGNQGKIREIREILGDLGLTIVSLADVFGTVVAIPETGETFEENARLKAAWVHDRTGEWTLADDSGLEVDILHGAPGVRSARYAGEEAGDAANVQKLLGALEGVPEEKRTARFRCVVVWMADPENVVVVEGECRGRIIETPRGSGGFGYDPVFVPDGYTNTFAELDPSVKNTISHRGRALRKLREKLEHRYEWKRG